MENLAILEKLADCIKAKNLIVDAENLVKESLLHNYGTLNEEQAEELLWLKMEQITKQMIKEGYRANSFICPFSLEFIAWSGEKMPWSKKMPY